jgi:hypothetical protein
MLLDLGDVESSVACGVMREKACYKYAVFTVQVFVGIICGRLEVVRWMKESVWDNVEKGIWSQHILLYAKHGSRYCAVKVRLGLIGRCAYAENGGKNGVNGPVNCM